MDAIRVRGLYKAYDGVSAVDGIDMTVGTGEVVGLLGPNGAGKTTTVEILEGHRRRDRGEVTVLGVDPESGGRVLRERLGMVLQDGSLEGELSVVETLDHYGRLYPRRRPVAELMGLVGLVEAAHRRVKHLSGGQRRRLELALGLVGDPDLLILDEPTTGFDPAARRQAWELIDGLRHLGKTILLTTHYLEEARRLADRVIIIDRGRVVAQGPPELLEGGTTVIRFVLPAGLNTADLPFPTVILPSGEGEVTTDSPTSVLHRLTGLAMERGIELERLRVERPSLEDVYMDLLDG